MADTFVVKVDNREVLVGLDETKVALSDVRPWLAVASTFMFQSIQRTFDEEGSPAGSWPQLAASTMRKKKYTSGHKLLVLSGLLRSSIQGRIQGNTLTIGTNLPYAAVQQFGSADRRGGSIGPQARVSGRAAKSGRFQNIPARPYLVFRPDDPQNLASSFQAYIAGKLRHAGAVTGGAA